MRMPLAQGFVVLCLFCPRFAEAKEIIAPARTVEDSKRSFEDRFRKLLDLAAESPLPESRDDNGEAGDNPRLDSRDDVAALSAVMTAKILRGEDLGREEEILLDPKTKPFAAVGSSFREPGQWCARRGDYDFSLIEYLRILLVARERPGALSISAQDVIRDKLLTLRGGQFSERFRIPCLPLWPGLRDTENHRLMMAVAQYLTNQILWEDTGEDKFKNASNGMGKTLLSMLESVFEHHFEEYNSRPYQQFSLQALHLLYGFAKDPELTRAARLLLDYASLTTSLQSLDLRRFVAFRRQPQYRYEPLTREPWVAWKGDGEVARWAFLAGNYGYRESQDFDTWSGIMLSAAVSRYRIPDEILSLAMEKARNPYYLLQHHGNFEAYAADRGYLLSAGGIFDKQAPPAIQGLDELPRWMKRLIADIVGTWNEQQHGWAMPTVLIPEADKTSRMQDLLRFEGHPDAKQRQNTCVAPGLLCGSSLEVPVSWSSCGVKRGDWTFYALDGQNCSVNLGLYLAVLQKQCEERKCREQSQNGTYGLAEVTSDASEWDTLQANALLQGEDFSWNQPYVYRTRAGYEVELVAVPKLGERSIRRVEGQGRHVKFALGVRQGERWEGFGVRVNKDGVAVKVPTKQEWFSLDWRDVKVR